MELDADFEATQSLITLYNAQLVMAWEKVARMECVIEEQQAIIAKYETILNARVMPLCESLLRQGREHQGAFVLDGE